MADVDFNINIRTVADTTGIKLTQQGLDALKVSALQGNQQAIAALQQLTNAQRQAAAGAGNVGELGRLVGTFTGVGIAGGILSFVNGLKQASNEIAKISEDLDKQGEQLVKHAQLFDEQSRHAENTSDVLKVSDATLKDIESTQKKFNELSQQEVGIAAQVSDYLQTQLLARQRAAGIGDYEAAQQRNLQTALEQMQAARQKGMDELIKAEDASNQTFEERSQLLQNEIAEQEKLKQAALDNTDPGGYAKAGNNLVRLNKLLEDTNKLEAERREKESREKEQNDAEREKDRDFVQEQVKRASPTARSILRNEQSAQIARDQGRDRDAELFQRTADQFKQSATPQQQQEVGVLEKLIEQNGLLREIRDTWK